MRDKSEWVIALTGLAVLILVLTMIRFYPDTPKPKKPIKLPTAEQVGAATGKTAKNFTKGFAKGIKE